MPFILLLNLPMLLFWSLSVLLTPFGWLRALPLAAAVVGAVFFWRRDRWVALGFGTWAALAYLLDLLSWWLSLGPIEPGRGSYEWVGLEGNGLAGFPLHALEIPPGAMGGDQPTAEQWWIVMTNLGFWGVVAAVVIAFVLARWRHPKLMSPALPWIFLGVAFLLNQFLSATFMLWFD